MRTYFYKILYKGKDVVYVGVTTRSITKRFKEHLISKELNENYSVIEFDCIEHPEFTTLEVFYEEQKKVSDLEKKYIREETSRGSQLLNISNGGEWGSRILEKLKREEFRKKFGSYDNYQEHKRKVDACCTWLRDWVKHRSENKAKKWIGHWVECRSYNRTKRFLQYWVKSRGRNAVKTWMLNWVYNRSNSKVKSWVNSWVDHRSTPPIKTWLRNWVNCRSRDKIVVWLRNWIVHRK